MTPAAPDLRWSVRPVRQAPRRGILALGVALVAALAAWALAGPVMGLLALLLLAGGVGPFFATSHYRLSEDGVEVRSPFLRVKRPWSDFRRAYVGRLGVSLSPFRSHHVLEPYRSVMLRFGTNREAVLGWVRGRLPEPPPEAGA